MQNLINVSQLACYIHIIPGQVALCGQEMSDVFKPLEGKKFKVCDIRGKEDIWPEFAKLFGGKYDV